MRFIRFTLGLGLLILLESCASIPVSRHAPETLSISYRLHQPGNVSLAVYGTNGIVRELRHAEAQTTGRHTIIWDGRDDDGKPVAAGKYDWKLLAAPGFKAEYLMSPGASYAVDNNGPYWAQAPGCHGGPATVAVDDSGFYVGAFSENIETTLLKQSLSGAQRLWSMRCPAAWTGPTAMAVAGQALWAYSVNNGKVYRYDLTTGALSTTVVDGTFNNEKPADMAVNDTSIILCYPGLGLVRWLDHAGTQTQSVPVAGANAVDVTRDGSVYVMTGSEMLQIPNGASAAQPFIKNLTAPRRAAINPGNGEIYLVEAGTSNRIKRFSSAGVLLQTCGANGGRTDGLYQTQRNNFRGVADIAVNAAGDFWVAEGEAAPRRVAHFDRAGNWIAEWYGGQTWAPWIVAEPDNPRFVWMASHWGDMMRLELDFAHKTWQVHSCYHYAGLADGLIRNRNNGDAWEARVHNGQLYLLEVGFPLVIRVDRQNWQLLPASVAVNWIVQDPNHPSSPAWVKKQAAAHNPVSQSMLWTDVNGDGRALNADGSIQAEECQFFPVVGTWPNGTINPDAGLNYLFHSTSPSDKIARFTVGSWTASQCPVYTTFPTGEVMAVVSSRQTGPYDGRWSSFLTSDASGRIWGAFNAAMRDWGTSTNSFVARYDADGRLAWTVGRQGEVPGTFRTLRRICGVVNRCVVVTPFSLEWPSEGATPVYVYNEDGLYAGQLLGEPVNTNAPNWRYSLGAESLASTINQDAKGNVYFFGHWINEARVYKITGWTGWTTAHGTVTALADFQAPAFIPEVVAPNGPGMGLTGKYFTTTNWTDALVITRVDPTLDYVWNPNGTLTNSPTGTASYSVRWTGHILPRRTGWHMFRQARGGGPYCEYKVNGLVFQNYELAGHAIWLEAGKPYPIQIDYTNYYQHPSGMNGVLLQWSEPECNGAYTTIPASQLMP